MSSLEKLNEKSTKTAFDKKVVSAAHHLHPYVKHRLYIGESMQILPKNMYNPNGIIDESIAKLYENGYNIDNESSDIKLKLFKIVDSDLYTLFKKEAFHKETISTKAILHKELESLEENYTIDDGFDYIMNEELNDISYKQHDKHKHVFLYDDNDNSVLNAFDVNDITVNNSKKALGNLYSWLPLNVSNIVDLYVFGKLSFDEISKIKSIETKRITLIFNEIKKNFNDHID
jgi:hypothetical protein